MVERTQYSALAIHGEISRSPNRWSPDVTAENRIVSRQLIERVVVPATAVVRSHDKDWVFVPIGDKKFKRIALQLGPPDGDGTVQVVSGLKPQDKVVTNGLQMSSSVEE